MALGIGAFVFGNRFVRDFQPIPMQEKADEMSVEAQKARQRLLLESINDLKEMRTMGEVGGKAYLERIRQLREQLAEVNTALATLGVEVKAKTINCPHCTGTLELGTDRCEYCGQIVIV